MSAPTDPAASTPAGDQPQSPQLAVNVEFMSDYRLASQLMGNAQFAVVPTNDGQAEIYALNSSGTATAVVRIFSDPTSDTGWSLVDLDFPAVAETVAAYAEADGTTVVFARAGSDVYTTSSSTWSAGSGSWQKLPNILLPSGTASPGGLRCFQGVSGGSFLAVDFSTTFVSRNNIACWINGAWSLMGVGSEIDSIVSWCPAQISLDGALQPGTYVGGTWDQTQTGIVAMVEGFFDPTPNTQVYSALACVPNNGNPSQLFGINRYTGQLYFLDSPQFSTSGSASQYAQVLLNTPATSVSGDPGCIAAATDANGTLHVFAKSADGTAIYHVAQASWSSTGWGPCVALAAGQNFSALVALTTTDGNVRLYMQTGTGIISQAILDLTTTEWTITPIEIDITLSDAVEQVTSYTATVTSYRANGFLGAGLGVKIESPTDPVALHIDGRTVYVDPAHPWQGTIGPDGQLSISYETVALSAPMLLVWLEGMTDTSRYQIDFSGAVRNTLASLDTSGAELLKKQTATSYKLDYQEGNLLQGVDQTQAAQISQAVLSLMQLAVTDNTTWSTAKLHPSSKPYVAKYTSHWNGVPPNQIHASSLPDLHFRIDLSGTDVRYEALDAESAQRAKEDALGRAGSSWQNISWGDLFAEVKSGLAQITECILQTAGEVVEATITLVINTVQYVWNTIVQGVEDLLDLVEVVFDKIRITFLQLLGWLGYVFNWGDILRTHQALVAIANNGLQQARVGLTAIQGRVGAAITQMQTDIAQTMETYITTQFPSGATIASVAAAQPSAPAGVDVQEDPRNVFARAFRVNGSNTTITPSQYQPSEAVSSAATSLLTQLQSYGSQAEGSSQFNALVNFTNSTGNDPSTFYTQAMATLLELVKDAAVYGLQLVKDTIDTVFTLLLGAMDAANAFLNDTWHVPLLTDLYAWITDGGELKPMEVLCLLIAIPTTITYKILFNAPPVPDQASLNAIQQALSPSTAAVAKREGSIRDSSTSKTIIKLAATALGLSYITYAFVESRVDWAATLWNDVAGGAPLRATPRWQGNPPVPDNTWWVTKITKVWEIALVANEIFTSGAAWAVTVLPNEDTWDCSPYGMLNWIWAVDNFEPIGDLIALAFTGSVIRNLWGDAGPFVISAWGVVQLVCGIWVGVRLGKKEWVGSVATIFSCIPEFVKYGIAPKMQRAADNFPIPGAVVVGCDIIFNTLSGIFWMGYAVNPP